MRKYSTTVLESAICPALGASFVEACENTSLRCDQKKTSHSEVSAEEFVELWNAIIDQAEKPFDPTTLGKKMAIGPGMPIFLAFNCAPNLKIGLERFSKYKAVFGPIHIRSESTRSGIAITILPTGDLMELPGTMTVAFGAFLIEKTRGQTARHIIPRRICLPEGTLEPTLAVEYFGRLPESAPVPRIEFSELDAQQKFLSENVDVWRFVQVDLENQLQSSSEQTQFSVQVDAAIRTILYEGQAHAEVVCSQLGISRSTLQRRLAVEGTTFQEVYNLVRVDLAERYLSQTLLDIVEVARLVGFRDPKSFHRSFKKWFNVTPEQFRNAKKTRTDLAVEVFDDTATE